MLLNVNYFVSKVYGNECNVEIHFAQTRLNRALKKVQEHMILISAGTSTSFRLLSSVILAPMKLVYLQVDLSSNTE